MRRIILKYVNFRLTQDSGGGFLVRRADEDIRWSLIGAENVLKLCALTFLRRVLYNFVNLLVQVYRLCLVETLTIFKWRLHY